MWREIRRNIFIVFLVSGEMFFCFSLKMKKQPKEKKKDYERKGNNEEELKVRRSEQVRLRLVSPFYH